MPANCPKCIVFKAPNHTLTDAELQQVAVAVPLANDCLTCQLRAEGKLTKMCWKNL